MGRERELWNALNQAIREVALKWRDSGRLTHRTADIVRVHLWATLHERPLCWACDADHWPRDLLPITLPDQSTLSRRTRGEHGERFERFLQRVAERLDGDAKSKLMNGSLLQLRRLDGTALTVATHSKDPDARWGRATGQNGKGYKIHALRSVGPMPEQWCLTPLDVDERVVARRFVRRLRGAGYLLCDSLYDGSLLHDLACGANHHLLVPRRRSKRGGGLGHRYQSPRRLASIALLETPATLPGGALVRAACSGYGPSVHARRVEIERDFGNSRSFGGGLTALPAWVRRIWRVRNWVYAKLLIDGARRKLRA